jgi:hypothetical protein
VSVPAGGVRIALASAVVMTLTFVTSVVAMSANTARMTALVGRAGTPVLTNEAGLATNRVPAGSYQLEIRDRSSKQNFHLKFQGVGGLNRRTTLRFVGRTTWTVMLGPGTYVYFSDNHSLRKRRLTVY